MALMNRYTTGAFTLLMCHSYHRWQRQWWGCHWDSFSVRSLLTLVLRIFK